MPYYETVFMSRAELNESQVKELTEAMSKIITDQGGKILKTEQWGLRTLAYRINKSRKANYTLIESDVDGAAIIEMERQMRINEDVIRYLSIKLEEPSKEPSAPLRKSSRDDDKKFDKKFDKKEAA